MQLVALTDEAHAAKVSTRVVALKGVHTRLHHTAIEFPPMVTNGLVPAQVSSKNTVFTGSAAVELKLTTEMVVTLMAAEVVAVTVCTAAPEPMVT
jgi:hypothetical protein